MRRRRPRRMDELNGWLFMAIYFLSDEKIGMIYLNVNIICLT
jgi:hypothetical protein